MNLFKKGILLKCVIGVVVFCIAKDVLFGWTASAVLSSVLGTRVRVGSAHLGIFANRAQLKNLKIWHPKGFGRGYLLQAPLIDASVNPFSLIVGKPHFSKLIVVIHDVEVVHSKEGHLNVDELKVSKIAAQNKLQEIESKKKWKVDVLDLSIYRVVSIDLRPEKPVIESHELNLRNAKFENLQSAEAIVSAVLVQSLQAAAIKGALIYGSAAALGMVVWPVGVAFLLTASGESGATLRVGQGRAYRAALKAAKTLGTNVKEERRTGLIRAEVNGTETEVRIKKEGFGKTRVSVSSKQFILPKPKTAAGLLYLIEQNLK